EPPHGVAVHRAAGGVEGALGPGDEHLAALVVRHVADLRDVRRVGIGRAAVAEEPERAGLIAAGHRVGLAIADLDGNGKPDAVTCGYQSSSLGLFRDGCAPDPNPPHITKIRDVPNDQGGKVFITWTKSSLDATGGPVNGYTVWRLVPPAGVAALIGPAS